MSKQVCPESHTQRDTCIRSLAQLVAHMVKVEEEATEPIEKGPAQIIELTIEILFIPVHTDYLTLRRSFRRARSTEKATASEAKVAVQAYDAALRGWTKSVKDAEGRLLSRKLADLADDVLPGEMINQSPARKITLTTSLLEQLPELPELHGDPALLSELELALAGLSEKVGIADAAVLARQEAKRALDAATALFDRKWMDTVRVIRAADAELARTKLPSFPTNRKKKAKAAPAPSQPSPPSSTPEGTGCAPAEVVPDEPEEDLGDEREEDAVAPTEV